MTARRERGAAAVEFAIILPLLILVVAGIIDMGRLFYAEIIAANAAREGARMSAIGFDEAEVRSEIQDWDLGAGLISPTPPSVIPDELCPTSPDEFDRTQWTVSYPDFDWILLGVASSFFTGANQSGPVPSATATMRCGG